MKHIIICLAKKKIEKISTVCQNQTAGITKKNKKIIANGRMKTKTNQNIIIKIPRNAKTFFIGCIIAQSLFVLSGLPILVDVLIIQTRFSSKIVKWCHDIILTPPNVSPCDFTPILST